MSLEDRSFDGPSAVGQYWIAHSEGFAVESPAGQRLGTVEAVGAHPETSEPVLVLRRPALLSVRRGVVRARRVALVQPWSERLALVRASKLGAMVPARKRSTAGEWLGRVSRRPRAAGTRARPHVVAALLAAGSGARRGAAVGEEILRATPAVAAAVGVSVAGALRAYAVWVSLTAAV